jgi:alanyl-tRNA synthetase
MSLLEKMTVRLYYTDCYETTFDAQIVETLTLSGGPAVVLDKTCFYPTSGGQPCDYGSIDGVQVIDVFIREDDQAIVHALAREPSQNSVTGEVEWSRRFDHMQHHTGQHLLSQAFLRIVGAETVSFHLGSESCTIDLNMPATDQEIQQVEALANQVIWQDRPVHIAMVSRKEAETLSLRQVPQLESGQIRLIDIEDFDLTACGGTHVSQTGAVGIVKVVGLENRRDGVRVAFLCGKRALADYELKNGIVSRMAAQFTTGHDELERSVSRLREELKQSQRELKRKRKQLISVEAAGMVANHVREQQFGVVSRVFSDLQPMEMRALANEIVNYPSTVALLGLSGPRALLIFARSQDAPGDMSQLMRAALAELGSHSGGGTAVFAQGSADAADETNVGEVLLQAEQSLLGMNAQ